MKVSVIEPERNRTAVIVGDSCFSDNGAFCVSADILDGEEQGSKFCANLDVPDIALVEHVQKRVKSGIGFQQGKGFSEQKFVILERSPDKRENVIFPACFKDFFREYGKRDP